jgi:hypothetical protein
MGGRVRKKNDMLELKAIEISLKLKEKKKKIQIIRYLIQYLND